MLARILLPITAATAFAAAPAVAAAAFSHTVGAGESLSSVAAADGLTVDQLAAANGMSSTAGLVAGTTLMIPPQQAGSYTPATGSQTASDATDTDTDTDSVGASTAASAAPAGGGSYLVQPGDTLSAIAARSGLSVDSLAAANGLDPSGVLLSGSVLRLSGSSAAVPVVQSSGTAATS